MSRTLDEDWRQGEEEAQRLLGPSPNLDDLLAEAPKVTTASDSLLATLRRLDAQSEPDPSRSHSIEKMAAGAPVIITGQQPGLLGGSLLVSFKIATAILLARRLEEAGQTAVPMFWNASEDHDLDEANRLYLRSSDRSSTELHHLELEGRGRSLDRITVGPDAAEQLREMFHSSGESLGDEAELPQPGEDLGRWMTRIQAHRFRACGLIIVEPRDLLTETRATKGKLLGKDRELRTHWNAARDDLSRLGYEPQLGTLDDNRSLMLLSDDDGRRRLNLQQDTFVDPLHDTPRSFGTEDQVDQLSPSALLRPLVQQAALPVLAQVSGPAETRYFAECRPLFAALDLRAPRLWPRATGAILHGAEIAAAAELPEGSNLRQPESWPEVSSELPAAWSDLRRQARTTLQANLDDLEGSITEDAQLRDLIGAIRRPLDRGLQDFEQKMDKAHRRRDRDRRQRRDRLREALFPRGRAQERLRSHGCYPQLKDEALGASLISRMTLDHTSPQFISWSDDA